MTEKDLVRLGRRMGYSISVENTETKRGYVRTYIRQIEDEFFTKSSADQTRALAKLDYLVWGK